MVNQSAFKETRVTQLTRMRQQEKNTVDRKTALLPAPDLFKNPGEHIFSLLLLTSKLRNLGLVIFGAKTFTPS